MVTTLLARAGFLGDGLITAIQRNKLYGGKDERPWC
jgi:hypothetical protein